jgi:hypothetical protein
MENMEKLDNISREQLIYMLKEARELAWISYADDRTLEESKIALRSILVATRDVGNEPNKK